jgi:hypothetical protein
MLKDPDFSHVNIDISWDQVAKYIVETPATGEVAADLMNRYPYRFLFGTDDVAPPIKRLISGSSTITTLCGSS